MYYVTFPWPIIKMGDSQIFTFEIRALWHFRTLQCHNYQEERNKMGDLGSFSC